MVIDSTGIKSTPKESVGLTKKKWGVQWFSASYTWIYNHVKGPHIPTCVSAMATLQ